MTTISPAYTSVRKVRLEVGGFIKNVPDYTLQTAILEGSIEADILTFQTSDINTSLYEHARREYVTCLAASSLLNNISSGSLRSKTLGDLSVWYNPDALKDAMGRALDCLDKWEAQVIAGGYARAGTNPARVIKGELDPDRITPGRLWESTEKNIQKN